MKTPPAEKFFRLLLFLVAGALTAVLQAEPPYFSRDLGVQFPATLGGMPLVDVTDYERDRPGLGIGLSYRKDGIKADIYIYTSGQNVIPSGTDAKLLTDHFYGVSRDVMQMEKLGHYRNVQILVPREQIRVGRLDFLHAWLRFDQEDAAMESHVYLTGLANRFVKIRFSFPESKAETARPVQEAFFRQLGRLFNDPPQA